MLRFLLFLVVVAVMNAFRVTNRYAITNHSPIAANDITAYALVGLNDGVNGLGGGPECQDWQYGLDIPGNSTYTFDRVFSTSAPNARPSRR